MKIRPLGDRLLVKRVKEVEKTKGGIIIPDTAKEKPQEGKVMAVGKGKMTEAGKLVTPEVKAATRSCLASIPAARSRSTARSISSCARMTSWAWSKGNRANRNLNRYQKFSELKRGKQLCPPR